jgi:hypothetical protein
VQDEARPDARLVRVHAFRKMIPATSGPRSLQGYRDKRFVFGTIMVCRDEVPTSISSGLPPDGTFGVCMMTSLPSSSSPASQRSPLVPV